MDTTETVLKKFFKETKKSFICLCINRQIIREQVQSLKETVLILLGANCGGQQYLEKLDNALSGVDFGRVEVVAVSCGFDTHLGDLASLGLVGTDYWQIGKRIGLLKKPVFFVLEGGYVGENIGLDIDALLKGYEENKV